MDEKLLNQLHFYFSDSNLMKDKFLISKIKENQDRWVPLDLFLSFNKYEY